MTVVKLLHGLVEVGLVKIRPKLIEDNDFGVAELPEHEVGEAEFPGGADEEVRVGVMGGVEVSGELVVIDLLRGEGAVGYVLCEAACSIDDFFTGAVGEGEGEGELGIVSGLIDGGLEAFTGFLRQHVKAADGLQLDVLLDHFLGFFFKETIEEGHEGFDFGGGAFPVFGGKRVESEMGGADVFASLDGAAHGFGACAMTCSAGEATLFRPPSITIHDDGDMFWWRVRGD